MRPGRFPIAAVLFTALPAILAALLSAPASAQSPALRLKAPQAQELLASGKERGRARIIVEMEDEASGGSEPAADPTRKLRIRQAQDRLLSSVLGAGAGDRKRAIRRMRTMPVIALQASPEEMERFAAEPAVQRIFEDRPDRPLLNEAIAAIGMPNVFRHGGRGGGRIVVVMDAGVLASHPFLQGTVIDGACFTSTVEEEGYESTCPGGKDEAYGIKAGLPCEVPICMHGTAVAGIVAGHDGEGKVRRGTAPKASIVAIKVFSRQSGTSSVGAYPSDQIRALDYVLELSESAFRGRIAAVNMSLGGSTITSRACNDDSRRPIIEQLRRHDIATVIAAGNGGSRSGVPAPACISAAITVGATSANDELAWFSDHGRLVDLLAPGEGIRTSTIPKGYEAVDGTSFAAPFVSGAIAALRSIHPHAPIGAIEHALENTGVAVKPQEGGPVRRRIEVDLALPALEKRLTDGEEPAGVRVSGSMPTAAEPVAVPAGLGASGD